MFHHKSVSSDTVSVHRKCRTAPPRLWFCRREHSSRFKVMFYVIGSEDQSRVLLSYCSRQQNQRRGGAVRYFSEHRIRVGQTRHFSIWSNIFIQLLCSGVPLCHYYTDTSLIRQASECLSLYLEFQRAKINGIRKRSLYWLGHLGVIYQRVLENNLHIPPEKTFTFAPSTENFFSSDSR